jgi:putative FmdB family regulatory protein
MKAIAFMRDFDTLPRWIVSIFSLKKKVKRNLRSSVMPTYEYKCAACKHEFERFESIVAKPDTKCPKCKKKKGVRQISCGGGFIFKGSGFYITDYKKSSGNESTCKGGEKEKSSGECKVKTGEVSSPADCTGPCSATPADKTANTESKSEVRASSSTSSSTSKSTGSSKSSKKSA